MCVGGGGAIAHAGGSPSACCACIAVGSWLACGHGAAVRGADGPGALSPSSVLLVSTRRLLVPSEMVWLSALLFPFHTPALRANACAVSSMHWSWEMNFSSLIMCLHHHFSFSSNHSQGFVRGRGNNKYPLGFVRGRGNNKYPHVSDVMTSE